MSQLAKTQTLESIYIGDNEDSVLGKYAWCKQSQTTSIFLD